MKLFTAKQARKLSIQHQNTELGMAIRRIRSSAKCGLFGTTTRPLMSGTQVELKELGYDVKQGFSAGGEMITTITW